jgi:hypothetical protein
MITKRDAANLFCLEHPEAEYKSGAATSETKPKQGITKNLRCRH